MSTTMAEWDAHVTIFLRFLPRGYRNTSVYYVFENEPPPGKDRVG